MLQIPVGHHEVAIREVQKLAAALARQTGQVEQVAKQQLWQKLEIILMKLCKGAYFKAKLQS